MKRLFPILVIAFMALALFSCEKKEQEVPVSSISLSQATAEMIIGETTQLKATVLPSNATLQSVTWASSKQSVATVSSSGVVTAIAEGVSTITASAGGKSAICLVTVSKGYVAVTSVTLNKTELTLKKGETESLAATVSPSDATDQTVTWSSSASTIASVDNSGKVTAVTAGSAVITAKAGDKQATCTVIVTIPVESITLDRESLTLEEEASTTLVATVKPDDATDKTVAWSSSNNEIATVDEMGKVTAIKEGEATITAKAGDKTATCAVTVQKKFVAVTSISLNKTELPLYRGQSEVLVATVLPEDATDKTVSWSSSNANIASVDNDGKVTAVESGSAIIMAKAGDKEASCNVVVTVPVASVSLDKTELTLAKGKSEKLIATVKPDDASNKSVQWESSDNSIATVSQEGIVTAVAEGKATITASSGGKSATCSITVLIPVTGVSLNVTSVEMMEGESFTLIATVTPSDATTQSIQWSTSDSSVATVDGGHVTARNAGHCVITVTTVDGSFTAECEVKVKLDDTPSVWDGSSVSYEWYERSTGGIYHIKTAAELAGLSKAFSQGYYKYGNFAGCTFYLDRDIDLASKEWTPIGTLIGNTYYCFAATFEGNGHTIKGLRVTTVNKSSSFQIAGLFGCAFTDGFAVKDLTVSGKITVQASSDLSGGLYTGGIIGLANSRISLDNCHSNVEIYADALTGSSITVYAGGIIGAVSLGCHLERCSSKGKISVTISNSNKTRTGGIIGQFNVDSGVISRCSSSMWMTVSSGKTAYIGGIAGTASSGEINNCLFNGFIEINGSNGFVGGMIANPFSTFVAKNCLMLGEYYKTNGTSYLSAIFGMNSSSFSTQDTYYLNTLRSSTSFGTPISENELKKGTPLSGFDTSIWAFPSGNYPYLLFE